MSSPIVLTSLERKALLSKLATALMEGDTDYCTGFIKILTCTTTYDPTCLNITCLLDLEDEHPALLLFIKYHFAHKFAKTKQVLFDMLKTHTPAGTTYLGQTMEHWQTYFERSTGPISLS